MSKPHPRGSRRLCGPEPGATARLCATRPVATLRNIAVGFSLDPTPWYAPALSITSDAALLF